MAPQLTRTGRDDSFEYLTSAEVAAILKLRVSTIEDYARRGVLPSIKVGRHRRYLRSQIHRALSRLADL